MNMVYTYIKHILIDCVIGKGCSQQSAIKFLGSQKLHTDFQLHEGVVSPNPCVVQKVNYINLFSKVPHTNNFFHVNCIEGGIILYSFLKTGNWLEMTHNKVFITFIASGAAYSISFPN